MDLQHDVYDLWVFRRSEHAVEYLLLHTSPEKAARHFNGGRFWQIPSGQFAPGETVLTTVDRELARYGLAAGPVWAAEHCYTIYNRRFDAIQIISVFAVEVAAGSSVTRLNPAEHSEHAWLQLDEALERVHYRGLKDGLRSVHEYITGVARPRAELRLR